MLKDESGSVSIVGLLIILLLVVFLAWKYSGSDLEIKTTSDSAILTNSKAGNLTIKFSKMPTETITGIVYEHVKEGKRRELNIRGRLRTGESGTLIYLTPSLYQTVLNKFESLDKCPAGFLNENVQQLKLIPIDDSLWRGIHNYPYKKGDKFSIQGSIMHLEGIDFENTPATMSGPMLTDYFLTQSFNINGSPIPPSGWWESYL